MSTVQSAINKDCVKIGKGCYIAPGVQIISEVGDIVIGDFTIIEEGCFIRNNQMKRMTIGSYNIFEIGCRVENSNIGDCNIFEMRCINILILRYNREWVYD
jgi:dynactin-6